MTGAVFFYGTLRHLPLLEVVLGRAVAAGELSAAHLPGAQTLWVAGASYPMIQTDLPQSAAGQGAPGLLMRAPSDEDHARMAFYEGAFGYALRPATLGDGTPVQFYAPGPEVGPPGAPFDLEAWAAQWGALSVEAACAVMGWFGQATPADMAKRFPTLRLRAASRLRAAEQRPRQGMRAGTVDVLQRTIPYSDFFQIDDYTLTAETFDGGMSAPMHRAVFSCQDAALVLPYDPMRDRVLLVEQFRMGPFGRGDPYPWVWEPIAGLIDAGERPEEAAHREAQEEAGLTLSRLEPVAEAYPAPGAVSEYYYMYLGIAELPDDITGVAGLAEEGENIRSHLLSFAAFMEMLERRDAPSVPLMLMGYWLARHRDRLRAR